MKLPGCGLSERDFEFSGVLVRPWYAMCGMCMVFVIRKACCFGWVGSSDEEVLWGLQGVEMIHAVGCRYDARIECDVEIRIIYSFTSNRMLQYLLLKLCDRSK